MYISMKNYFVEEILLSFKILQEEEAVLILKFLSSPLNFPTTQHQPVYTSGVDASPNKTITTQAQSDFVPVNLETC